MSEHSTEQLAFDRAMHQWEASLKRPDLNEKARVAGALMAYQRMLWADEIVAKHPPLDVLPINTPVVKPHGYPFPGEVRAVFFTVAGELRYVIESSTAPGLLHIFAPGQIEEAP